MTRSDHSEEVLRVYASRTLGGGYWHPDYGDLMAPEGWEILPPGDAFVTRTVKRLGPHWVLVRAAKRYTRTLGTLAPPASIREAERLADETKARRERARESARQRREAQESAYQRQFAEAVLHYLRFAPRHKRLARQIAEGSARQATVVSSGRVGRTAKLTLEEKAELAARAYIRHRHTDYEDRLFELGAFDLDDSPHGEARREAQEQVDEFLRRHRRRRDASG